MFNIFKKKEERSKTLDQLLLGGQQVVAGVQVNSNSAQTLPAVLCAVTTISEAVASLPINVFKVNKDGDKQRANGHYIERLLNHAPNDSMTGYDFKIALIRSLLLKGNAFAQIEFSNGGIPKELTILHPDSVSVKRISNNRYGYQVSYENGKSKTLLADEVIHIKINSDDGIMGKSPLTIARESIGLGLAQQEQGARLLANGMRPQFVLETDSVFKNENAIERLKQAVKDSHSGVSNTGGTMVLENGLKLKPVTISNSDSQWLESREFSVQDVARIFKISPSLLGDLSNASYSNYSQAQRAFLSQTLSPILTNASQAIAHRMVITNGLSTVVEFDSSKLLKASIEEQAEVLDKYLRNGSMSINEVRGVIGLSKLNGDFANDHNQSWLNQMTKEVVEE